ncbi:sulfotransferase [Phenylobacterium sp.]|uniref:sulfotransferase n=1 Tax=Phenylobacterium sp. TaxID=1871053 RepID=UPI003BAC623D
MTATSPQKIVFVGGAPRSGTSVTHALICSADRVSNYHPEASFLRGLLPAYRFGKAAWQGHTKAFFPDPQAFRAHIRETLDLSIRRLSEALGRPEILCLKDPHLTPFFPDLAELYADQARFVTVCRHPLEVVRSRQAVHEQGEDRPFLDAGVVQVAREYLTYYSTVIRTDFGGRHFLFRYEDLNTERVQGGLAGFVGVERFNPDLMWRTAAPVERDPAWKSPKHGGVIALEPRFEPLQEPWAVMVREICRPIMARLDYA